MNGQLSLDLFGERDHPIGLECPFCTGVLVNHVRCAKPATPVYVACHRPFFGDPPQCAFEPLDNSPEAMARRKAWAIEHESGDYTLEQQ